MKRLVTALASVGLMLALAPPAVSPAASNNATTLIPLPDGTQLETYARLDCHHANGSCDFTVGADRKTADGVTGFPNDLWSRQNKDGGSDEVTTIYMGEGPPEKYQTVGRIDSTDWRTGQPRLDVNVIACTHIQVVYSGVNITSPSTCAQANFS
jgi:hypothetical protein